MATLTGQTIAGSYKDLLKITASSYQAGLDSTLRVVEDGDATASPLYLGTTKVLIKQASSSVAAFEVEESDGTAILSIDAVGSTTKGVIINEDGVADIDFRVEGSSAPYALFVDGTNGNVGIGVAAPITPLQIHTVDANSEITLSAYADTTSTAPYITFRKAKTDGTSVTGVTDHILGGLSFSAYTNAWTEGASIKAVISGDPSNTANDLPTELIFSTMPDTGAAIEQRMVILPDGKVGIGVPDPDSFLEILGTTTQLKLSYDAENYAVFTIAADGHLTIESVDPDNGQADIALMPDGNAGIGVNDPDAKLEVLSTSTQLKLSYDADSFATFTVDSSDDMTIKPAASGGIRFQPTTTDTADFFQILDQGGGTPVFNVDSTNERVGIGTASPDNLLEVSHNVTTAVAVAEIFDNTIQGIHIAKTGTNDGAGSMLKFSADGDTNQAVIAHIADDTSGDANLAFYTSDAVDAIIERMRITSDGYVGIGTAAPTALLTVGSVPALIDDGTTAVTPEGVMIGITEASKYAMGIRNADVDGDGLLIQAGHASDDYALRVEDYDSGTDLFTVLGDGKVGIGTASPAYKLDVVASASGHNWRFFNDGNNADRHGFEMDCGADDGTTGTTYYIRGNSGNASAITGYLQHSGGTFSAADSSDVRLKKDIVDTTVNGLDTVSAIKVRDFKWKSSDGQVVAGLIANELAEAFAPAVHGEPDAVEDITDEDGNVTGERILPMTISRDVLVPVLIKAVQELSAKVTALENA